MVISAEFLGLLLLVTSAAALGLSIVMDVGRVSAEKARESMMQRQHEKRKAALTEWKRKTEQTRNELTGLQARHTEFTGRRQKALTEIKALEFAKVELVHELGDSDETTGFWAQLNVQDNVATIERRDVIFSRQIWEYRNVAHVFAPAPDQATALLRTAFTAKNGVLPSQIVPLSMAPDIGAGIGSKALSA